MLVDQTEAVRRALDENRHGALRVHHQGAADDRLGEFHGCDG